jgi:hypothetical protein
MVLHKANSELIIKRWRTAAICGKKGAGESGDVGRREESESAREKASRGKKSKRAR